MVWLFADNDIDWSSEEHDGERDAWGYKDISGI
jgi:hypothetical protein